MVLVSAGVESPCGQLVRDLERYVPLLEQMCGVQGGCEAKASGTREMEIARVLETREAHEIDLQR